MSKLEEILSSLEGTLETSLSATVRRNGVFPESVPTTGLVILRDGDPGEPEITLSPLTYHFEHTAVLEVFAPPGAFDGLKVAIGAAIATDRTLSGLCDWIEPQAPETENLAVEGSDDIFAAIIPVRLIFSTSDPLA